MKKIEVVAAIIKKDNMVLCCQRQENKLPYLSKKWEFPGGKVEIGESNEQALIREIQEELNIEIFNLNFAITVIHTYPDFQITMHSYIVNFKNSEMVLNSHINAVWSPINQLHGFDWAQADIPIVEFLNKNQHK
jgi:8-oxo-dGTP diphosphatase